MCPSIAYSTKSRVPHPSRSSIARWVGSLGSLASGCRRSLWSIDKFEPASGCPRSLRCINIFRRANGCPRSLALGDRGRFLPTLLLSLLTAFALPAQDLPQGPTFHIESKLVSLWVNVTDANGAFVGGLNKGDFRIYEDGRPQDIAVFDRESNQPLDVILAIDTSESTYKDRALEQAAAHKFIQALLRPQDQMSLFQFATDVTQLVPFTNSIKQLDHGLSHLHSGEATAVYDTIYLGSDELAKHQGRKVLVLVSDGGDTVQGTTYSQAVEEALRGEVMIYSIIDVPIESSAGRDLGGEHALITLSEQTGGKSFYADAHGLDAAFQKVSDDLRTQYLIGYYPRKQAPGVSFHHVTVTIPRAAPDAFNIRYRTGYYSEPPAKKRHIPIG